MKSILSELPEIDPGARIILTPSALFDCFASSFRPQRSSNMDLDRIAYCLDKNIVSLRAYYLPEVPHPPSADKYATHAFRTAGRDTGGDNHRDLKWRAWHWMHDHWDVSGEFEVSRSYTVLTSGRSCRNDCRFDIFARIGNEASKAKNVAIECGDTDVGKILMCLGNGNWPRDGIDCLAVVPFFYDLVLMFEPTEEGFERLKAHQRTRHDLSILSDQFNQRQHNQETFFQVDFMAGAYEPEYFGVLPLNRYWEEKKYRFQPR